MFFSAPKFVVRVLIRFADVAKIIAECFQNAKKEENYDKI